VPGVILVRPHEGGFFSNFNKVVSLLHSEIGRDGVTGVRVDWTLPKPIKHFPYGTPADGNVWERLFAPVAAEGDVNETVTDYPLNGRQLWTHRQAYGLYRRQDWRRAYNQTFARFVVPRLDLLERAERALSKAEGLRIGIHYRHPGHDHEMPRPIASVEYFIKRVRRLARGHSAWSVVLATDVKRVAETFREAFADRLIMQPDTVMSAGSFQSHEIVRSGSVALAEEVLIDAMMLSRCDVLLHVTSNIATAVGYMNPRLRMVYCEPLSDRLSIMAERFYSGLRASILRTPAGPPLRAVKRLLLRS
jgi:hypothetical protein